MAQAILNQWANTLYRERHIDIDVALTDYADTALPRDLDDAACPYPGLAPFDEVRRDVYVGRWGLIDEAVTKLAELGRDGRERFLFVVGLPGSGKTSLIRAGLLPRLRSGETVAGGAGRRYLGPVDLGADPLAQIVVAVRPDRAGDADWVGVQAARMMSDPGHLARLVDEPGGPPVVLTVDRFEQIFTPGGQGLAERFGLGRARRQVDAVAANLAELTRPGAGHTVILAVRRGDAVRVRGLAPLKDLLERGLIRVTPPGEKELREMIEGPAATVGLKFEKGVVDQLVRDVQGNPWALPLLQYALVRLWGYRERDLVTWKA